MIVSYWAPPASRPAPRLTALSMFLFGTDCFLAFWMASKSVGVPSMSAPPIRAATSMFLISFAKSLPRLASITAFLCFVVAHLEWPDIRLSPSRYPLLYERLRSYRDTRSACPAHHVDEQCVHPVVPGQLGVERRSEDVALPDRDRVVVVRREHLGARAHRLDPRRADEDALHGAALDALDVDRGLEGLVLAAEGVAAHDHVDAAQGLLVLPAVEDLVRDHDHTGAGAVHRHARPDALAQRLQQPEDHRELGHGGGLAAGDHQPLDLGQLLGAPHLPGLGAGRGERGQMLTDVALEGEHADEGSLGRLGHGTGTSRMSG